MDTVLATNFDPCLGGRNFDKILADYFQQDFKERYKVDAGKNMKARLRLETECERLKKLMSANTQSIPINIECFMDDKDVTGRMDRTQFEELSAGLLQRIETVFQTLLENSKMSTSDLAAVEIVGGSSRVPSIKSLVQKVFGIEPSTTLNADEAVARGCSLQNAILNPTFRVRDFSINDAQPYSITLSWQATMEEDSSMELFPKYHMIPMSKVLTFYRTEPFQLEAKYTHKNDVPIPDTNIGKFQVSKIEKPKNEDSAKVKVKNKRNRTLKLRNSPWMLMLRKNKQKRKEKLQRENKNLRSMEKLRCKQTNQKPLKKQIMMRRKKKTAAGDKKSEKKSEEKKKKKVKKIDLPIEAFVPEMSKKEINDLDKKENQMIMADKLEKERADAKNAVEEYVYDMRDKLSEAYEPFVKEADREKFSKLLSETEDWLYEEGDDQKKQVYLDKLTQLKNIGIPIKDRYDEFQWRPAAFDELGHSIQHVRKFLDLCSQKDEKFAHLSAEDIENCYDPPNVLAQQIRSTKQSLDTTCNPIMNKPKPKVEPPKEEKKDVKKEGENNGEKMETDSTKPGETPADSPKTEVKPEMDID
ncbi:HSPA4 [Mytilus edulis]|uniref:HSPA4 n=1 Tax=Mytilus edulis TaxID=6550 RepID=A0A8S3TWM3_MYTED|nr:HSPA4 [Mytilus edulis]